MHWYATLVDTSNLKLRDYLNSIRGSILDMDQNDPEEASGMYFMLIYGLTEN